MSNLEELEATCLSFCLTANDYLTCYEKSGNRWDLTVYWDNPVGCTTYEGDRGESAEDLIRQALQDPEPAKVYDSVREKRRVYEGRTIWDLAAKAQAEVERWPEWKRREADTALSSKR